MGDGARRDVMGVGGGMNKARNGRRSESEEARE